MIKNLIPKLGAYIFLFGAVLCVISFILLAIGPIFTLESSVFNVEILLTLLCAVAPVMELTGLVLICRSPLLAVSEETEKNNKFTRRALISFFILHLALILGLVMLYTMIPTYIPEPLNFELIGQYKA